MSALTSTANDFGLDYAPRTYPSSPNEHIPKFVQSTIETIYGKLPRGPNGAIESSRGSDDSSSLDKFKEYLNELNKLVTATKDRTLASENSLVDHIKSKTEVQNEILAFKELLSCWDGDDAEPIALGAINGACQFLESYHGDLMFDAFPDPDGSVGLEADFAEGRVILSFNDAGETAYLIRKNKAVHRGHSATYETINDLFSSLL